MEQSRVLAALSALAHDVRLEIVRTLCCQGPDGLCAGKIAHQLGLSASALSFHLSALTAAGLLVSTRQGRQVHYRLDNDQIGAVFGFVLNDCCGAQPAIRDRCLRLDHLDDQSGKSNTWPG